MDILGARGKWIRVGATSNRDAALSSFHEFRFRAARRSNLASGQNQQGCDGRGEQPDSPQNTRSNCSRHGLLHPDGHVHVAVVCAAEVIANCRIRPRGVGRYGDVDAATRGDFFEMERAQEKAVGHVLAVQAKLHILFSA